MSVAIDKLFWIKIGFIIIVFLEAFLTGLIPTWSRTCRESPKILGIANSFAAGVFLAIAFVHILPEEVENWEGLNPDVDPLFPLPYLLVLVGYTLILIIDKVMFDTHALFEDHDDLGDMQMDPAEEKLARNVRASMVMMDRTASMDPLDARKSMAAARTDLKDAVKEYLSKEDRFSTRLKATLTKSRAEPGENQESYFVDGNAALLGVD